MAGGDPVEALRRAGFTIPDPNEVRRVIGQANDDAIRDVRVAMEELKTLGLISEEGVPTGDPDQVRSFRLDFLESGASDPKVN